MNKQYYSTMNRLIADLASCLAFGGALYAIDAPWWIYVAALAFGTIQRLLARSQMHAEQGEV
jgi:fatty acid desaturase